MPFVLARSSISLALRLASVKRLWVMSASKSQTAQQGHHLGDRPHGEADGLRQPLLLDAKKLAERSRLGRRRFGGAGMLGIVQVQDVDRIEVQRLQALLDPAARLRGVKNVGFGDRGRAWSRRQIPFGRPPPPANDAPDLLLAAAKP